MATTVGEAWIGTAHSKIKALMDALITSMGTASTDPALSYAYDRHDTAKLQLNGVTVDVDGVVTGERGMTSTSVWHPVVQISVRVHTAYENGITDGQKISRLLNSVANKITTNLDLGNGYRVEDVPQITNRSTFEESATIGGEIIVGVGAHIELTQE